MVVTLVRSPYHPSVTESEGLLYIQGLFTISVVIQMLSVVHGVGHHMWELSRHEARTALFVGTYLVISIRLLIHSQYCYLYEIFYVLVGVGLKIALGIFYLRIAIDRWQILLIKFIIFSSAIFGFVCLFLVVFQCIPGKSIPLYRLCSASLATNAEPRIVSTFWLIYPANDQCIPIPAQSGITYALNAMNACTDWILGTLPFFMVRSLNLTFTTKMLVAGILAFAAVYVALPSTFNSRQLTSP
jgi:hypothetical protein